GRFTGRDTELSPAQAPHPWTSSRLVTGDRRSWAAVSLGHAVQHSKSGRAPRVQVWPIPRRWSRHLLAPATTNETGAAPGVAVSTPDRARVEPRNHIELRRQIVEQLLLIDARLTDDDVQVGILVARDIAGTALDVVDGLCRVHPHGQGLRLRHEAAGNQHAAH